MRVPTKMCKEEVVHGSVGLSGGAAIEVVPSGNRPFISLKGYLGAASAREAAQFFNNLANVLEGKEQE